MSVNQTKRAIFTICSGNYFPYARVLLSSLQIYHPEASLFLCLADTVQVGIELNLSGVEVIPVESLNILNFADFAFRYDIMEFNTAVKPFMMQWLMEEKGFEEVVYLDPDIELFAPMIPVFDAFNRGANFVLTPHIIEPAEFGEFPDDIGIMKAGIYNLGFIGVKNSRDGISFLHWWGRRLRFQCLNQQDRGLFVDQKFVDLLPAFHDNVTILRDRSLNVAYWNLDRRELTRNHDTWLINGEPLRFFHFSGIDLKQPYRLSKHTTRFNSNLKPALQEIIQHYLDKLVKFNYGVELYPGYSYSKFNNGIAISNIIRCCYCDLTELWLENPLETFQNYLNLPSEELLNSSPWLVTNLMYYIWSKRRDLQQAFNLQKDSKDNNNCLNYCCWFIENAGAEYALDNHFIIPIVENLSQYYAHQTTVTKKLQNNICVIGYLKAETGVGHAGRMVVSSLKNIGIPTQGYNETLNVMARQAETTVDELLTQKINSPIQIYNINADQLGLVRNHLKRKINNSAYKINMPFWELSKFPQPWLKNYQGINEVWAASRFIQATLQKVLSIPVFWLPPAVTLTKFAPRSRRYFELPQNAFLFHYNFDFSSFATRKNPQAAIKAYRLAFRNYQTVIDTALVIKTRGYDPKGKSLAQLQEFTANEPDIYILNQDMTYDETLALINCCDCYISLHRSEGFGYTPAEAMLLEKPVIATDYSGTKDFINQDTGFPVNYQLIPVKENEYPFWQDQTWAEPDLNHAAWLMRKMITDEAQTKAIACQGKAKILNDYSLEKIGKLYRARLKEIGVRD
jgi:glycosyltransferase involved in cell wall biosynthesis